MVAPAFDRSTEDMGNIVNLGHVNFRVADQRLATAFYISGLGLTRDPFMMTGNHNMWINVGDSQFHLPTGPATHAPVTLTGLVIPDKACLLERLAEARAELADTRFDFHDAPAGVEITCPWGNRLRCHEPDAGRFGRVRLNMAYVEFEVGRGVAARIGKFYQTVLGALVHIVDAAAGTQAHVQVGDHQQIIFKDTETPNPPCLAHHVQIYIADFSGPYRRLQQRDLVNQESSQHQFNFRQIVDVETGEHLFNLDHEVRSMRHPMYGRPLINRNPDQKLRQYTAGHDHFVWRSA